jgi:hypothetical protein
MIIKNWKFWISGVGLEKIKPNIETPVDMLEFISCETPLQSEYSRRV